MRMSIKTVRMDDDDEKLLERVKRATGWSASEVIKRGLRSLDRQLREQPSKRAFDVYKALDLGPGGYASGPASDSRKVAREAIRRRAGR